MKIHHEKMSVESSGFRNFPRMRDVGGMQVTIVSGNW